MKKNLKKSILFSLFGIFLLFGVFAKKSNPDYTSLMQDLDTAHKKIIKTVDHQEKRVKQDFDAFSGALQKDYSYMGLHCIGVMRLNFESKNTVKTDLLNNLIDFNTKIYKTKLGLSNDSNALQNEISVFISGKINKESDLIYQEFSDYKKQFLSDIKSYVKKNKSLILPLVNKMKFIDGVVKKHDSLKKFHQTTKDKFFKDKFLKKVNALQGNLRLILKKEFLTQVKPKITSVSGPKIMKIMDEYLADYDKSFDALYPVVLYNMDTKRLDTFIKKYYTNHQYQCSDLLKNTANFDQDKRSLSAFFSTETAQLTSFSNNVNKYINLSSKEKELKKIEMVKKLKILIDDFRGPKLRASLLKV